ncbi:hypothetical protein EfmAA290_25760 [Enterococcus faecium]|nr:hypothetical protein EfmAA290_25760 [Enterococcus faecium]
MLRKEIPAVGLNGSVGFDGEKKIFESSFDKNDVKKIDSKKMMKYMRYVLNDHFVLVCLFLIGGVGLYYSNSRKTLHGGRQCQMGSLTVFWMLCLFVGKMATFAEVVGNLFLLPKEKEMQTYLERALFEKDAKCVCY